MKKLLFIALIPLFFLACEEPETYNYQYSDGTGKAWLLKDHQLQFVPISIRTKSSHMSSTGTNKTVDLSAGEKKDLILLFRDALNDKSIQLKKRVPGSAMLIKSKDQFKQKVLLSSDAQLKNDIEAKIAALMEE